MWDLFISHASEDKENIVRPLAQVLIKCGVKVWYDEFSIGFGDSLSESIDRGLINSKYGLVIISPDFLRKKWTDYELKSLITKHVDNGKTILPIWHNVDKSDISSRSLFLADIKSFNSNIGVDSLAFEIIKVVRPDILSSHLTKKVAREITSAKHEKIALKDLKVIDGVRHKTLPTHLVVASQLIVTLFPFMTLKETLVNFAKDADYDREFMLWIIISCAYVDALRKYPVEMADESFNKAVFAYLLFTSFDDEEQSDNIKLNPEIKIFLLEAYNRHAETLMSIYK